MAGYGAYNPQAFPQAQAAQGFGPLPTGSGAMAVFIEDESLAATYPVMRGYVVSLICLSAGKMFLKSTDANGIPQPTRVFAMQEVTPQPQGADVVTRKEFDALSGKLNQLLAALQQPREGKAAEEGKAQ